MGTFEKKLERVLSETRRKPISKRLFHGTVSLETLHNILSNGLKPSHDETAIYLGPLNIALWYGAVKFGYNRIPRKSRIPQKRLYDAYLDKNIYIIEAEINLKSVGIDQDIFVTDKNIHDIPHLSRQALTLAGDHDRLRRDLWLDYDEDPEAWDRYFKKHYPKIGIEKNKREFAKYLLMYVREEEPLAGRDGLQKFAYEMRPDSINFKGDTFYQGEIEQCITIQHPIGIRGRNRIIGAYAFLNSISMPGRISSPECTCVEVIYSNNGSINTGFKIDMHYGFWLDHFDLIADMIKYSEET